MLQLLQRYNVYLTLRSHTTPYEVYPQSQRPHIIESHLTSLKTNIYPFNKTNKSAATPAVTFSCLYNRYGANTLLCILLSSYFYTSACIFIISTHYYSLILHNYSEKVKFYSTTVFLQCRSFCPLCEDDKNRQEESRSTW